MSLWHSEYSSSVKDLLKGLDYPTLEAIANTASKNNIKVTGTKEAVEVILRYTENLGKFFSYQRITKQILFQYLHKKKVAVGAGESNAELVERVKKLWENSLAKKQTEVTKRSISQVQAMPSPVKPPAPISLGLQNTAPSICTSLNLNLTSPGANFKLEVTHSHGGSGVRSHMFMEEFCKWFYTMMNRMQPQMAGLAGDTFAPDVFMANCCMDVYLYGPQTAQKHASGNHDAYLLLKGMCTDYNLCFVPNMDTGVQVEMSEHGLLKLFCCGTLHQGESMVGVFEQEFGLVRCPQGKWKIMMTKINLKQAHSIASLPVLSKGPVFEIP